MNERDKTIRFLAIRECGCIACRIFGVPGIVPTQIHHLNFGDKHGGKRLGDEFTVGLCPWHHQGYPINNLLPGQCRQMLGPSWELEPNAFRERFGNGEVLLAYQNNLLAAWHGSIVRGFDGGTGQ